MLVSSLKSCVILLSTCFGAAFLLPASPAAAAYCYGPSPCADSVGGSQSYPVDSHPWNGKTGAGTVEIGTVHPVIAPWRQFQPKRVLTRAHHEKTARQNVRSHPVHRP